MNISQKEKILKKYIKRLIRETLGYPDPGDVLTYKHFDEQYELQVIGDKGKWLTIDSFPTYQLANIELNKIINDGIPTKYRIVGTHNNTVYAQREILSEIKLLSELMSYKQLVSATQTGWATRFETVKNVKHEAPVFSLTKDKKIKLNASYYSSPSTTGKTHDIEIIFSPNPSLWSKIKDWWVDIMNRFKSFIGKKVPPKILSAKDLSRMNCEVSCTCPDFKYRFEVANYSKGASKINYSNGREPIIRNPQKKPGLCKHLLATLNYLTDDKQIEIPIQKDK